LTDMHREKELTGCQKFGQLMLQALAEIIGSFFLGFLGSGAISITGNIDSEAIKCTRIVAVSLLDGFLYYGLINFTMRLSNSAGGYLNPAVTLALALMDSIFQWRKIGEFFLKTLLFIAAQCGGCILGVLLVTIEYPGALKGSEKTGYSRPGYGATIMQAWGIEAICTFLLILVIFSVRRHERRRSSILIAFITICIRLFSYAYTGGFANPARSLASVIASGTAGLPYMWIYLTAPLVGATFAVFAFIALHKDIRVDTELQDTGDGGL